MRLKPWENALFTQELARLARCVPLTQMAAFRQHGQTNCLQHSVAVAYHSFALACRLGIDCNYSALLRGALLHDFFLYDWHTPASGHGLHAFTHPRRALENARRYCRLGKREENIILRHMFPLTPIPPRYREGVLVCLADKLCSIYEALHNKSHPAAPSAAQRTIVWRKIGHDRVQPVSLADFL